MLEMPVSLDFNDLPLFSKVSLSRIIRELKDIFLHKINWMTRVTDRLCIWLALKFLDSSILRMFKITFLVSFDQFNNLRFDCLFEKLLHLIDECSLPLLNVQTRVLGFWTLFLCFEKPRVWCKFSFSLILQDETRRTWIIHFVYLSFHTQYGFTRRLQKLSWLLQLPTSFALL